MSWFPSADPTERRSLSPDHGFFSLPTSPEQTRQRLTESVYDKCYSGLPIIDNPTWQSPGAHGLGFMTLPTTTDTRYHEPVTLAHSAHSRIPFTWPSELSISQAPTLQPHPIRKDSWSGDSCDPLETLLPGSWDHLQPLASSTAAYETSPGRSEYSSSSRPSVVSSPYQSDLYAQPNRSPRDKIETLSGRHTPHSQYSAAAAPYAQSQLVNPEVLVACAKEPFEERLKAYLGSSASSDVGDDKTTFKRPNNRRAISYEDLRTGLVQDRRKRGYTRPENASCSCDICGKLFQRSYNLKAHMETHDPHRSQPHGCQYAGCETRFVRRTDLLRHEQSVHVKARNYTCHLCSSSFARKDTLGRHIDDGCPRRTEVKRRVPMSRRASSVARTLAKSSREASPAFPCTQRARLSRLPPR